MDEKKYRALVKFLMLEGQSPKMSMVVWLQFVVNPILLTLLWKGGQGSFVMVGEFFKMTPVLDDLQPV